MARAHITDPDTGTATGWFDLDKATEYKADTEWNGHDRVDVNTSDYATHQILYRTAQGRWVLHEWSRWQGVPDSYQYVSDATAREWLIRNSEDDAVKEHFGEVEEERGPGRPEIGGKALIRFGDELLAQLDAWAKEHSMPRAEAARRAVKLLVGATPVETLVNSVVAEHGQNTWAVEGTSPDDSTWLAEAVAGNKGVAVWEDGRVLLDENAFNHLTTLTGDDDGVIEKGDNGELVMYAAGDAFRVTKAGRRGLGLGR